MSMRALLRGAALTLTAATVAACGSNSSGGGTPPAGSGGTVITIKDFGYGAPLTVAPGATVTVRQEDSVQHDVAGAAFHTGLLGKGETATFTAPAQPGSYDFTCSVHPRMHGRLVVRAAAGSGTQSDTGSGPSINY